MRVHLERTRLVVDIERARVEGVRLVVDIERARRRIFVKGTSVRRIIRFKVGYKTTELIIDKEINCQ